MKVKNARNKNRLNNHEKLIRLVSNNTPEDYQTLLNDIDLMLLNNSDLKPDDLPWLNPDKHEENWEKVIRELRLIIGKFVYEKHKRDRVLH